MKLRAFCSRTVAVIEREGDSLFEAARLMSDHGVRRRLETP
jgi:hypothetical protein